MTEKTLSTQRAFAGRLISLDVLEVELEPGVRARREVVRHPGAVAVLARDAEGRFVFVRQYRKPIERELLEIIAGCLEHGETPAQCAVREVKEETGYAVRSLVPLGILHPTPGYSDEIIHLFRAELAPGPGTPQFDRDERIVLDRLTPEAFEQQARSGAITDGKTLAAWTLNRIVHPDIAENPDAHAFLRETA